jgi:hypothetical protein
MIFSAFMDLSNHSANSANKKNSKGDFQRMKLIDNSGDAQAASPEITDKMLKQNAEMIRAAQTAGEMPAATCTVCGTPMEPAYVCPDCGSTPKPTPGETCPEEQSSDFDGWERYWASLDKDSQEKLTASGGLESARAWFGIGAVWGHSPAPASQPPKTAIIDNRTMDEKKRERYER